MSNEKNIILSYAAALQEIGVLFFVFGPMYLTFDSEASGWKLAMGMISWAICGFIFFRMGIEIQRRN